MEKNGGVNHINYYCHNNKQTKNALASVRQMAESKNIETEKENSEATKQLSNDCYCPHSAIPFCSAF